MNWLIRRWAWINLPTGLYALPLLFCWLLWGKRGSAEWWAGCLLLRLREGSWMDRTWGAKWGGCTSGHTILLSSKSGAKTLIHELHHVPQFDATGCAGSLGMMFSTLLQDNPLVGFAIWLLTPGLCYLGGGAAAWFSGGEFYRDNIFESTARMYANEHHDENNL